MTVAAPPGAWIRLHVGLPRNRKIRPLSDAAFRLHIELMCWAKEEGTDGLIEADAIPTFGRPAKVWTELTRRGLLDDAGGGDVVVHDFLEWQEPAAETRRKSAEQSKGGSRGNHERWHAGRGIVADSCPFCIAEPIG